MEFTFDSMFSDHSRLGRWIRVERAFVRFWLQKKNYGKEVIEDVMNRCDIDPYEVLGDINDLEDKHSFFRDVFLSKSPLLKIPEIEYGLGCLDLCHISNSLLIRDFNWLLFEKIKVIKEKLRQLALEHKGLVQIGRTHGIHGEPTSFGYRFAVMYSDLDRYMKSIFDIRKTVEAITFDYGNLLDPSLGRELQSSMSMELDLFVDSGGSLRTSRGCYFNFLSILNGMSQTINKHVLDLTLLSSKEIGELKVDGDIYEKMVQIELISREIDGNVNSYLDLTYGISVDRKEFDLYGEKLMYRIMKGVLEMIDRFDVVIDNVNPDIEAIERNLSEADESIFSQKVLLYLVRKTGYDRSVIADQLKKLSSKARKGSVGYSFKFLLINSPYRKYLSDEILEKLFDKDSFLVNVDRVYERIFGVEVKSKSLKKILWDENEINYAIDKLAVQLNREYANSKIPVTVIAFSERALIFVGNLLSKLNFPLIFRSIPHRREDLEIESISFDRNLIQSKRILIVDFLIHPKSNLDRFMDKIMELGNPFDFKVCSLLKFNNVTDEKFVVNWSAFECEPDDFYAGFGKNCGSSEFFRHLPVIGLAA